MSPNGHDKNPGTRSLPFASIEKARIAVRQKIKNGQKEDIVVFLHAGRYVLDKTVVFDREDGAKNGFKISYCAFPGEKVLITSAKIVAGWKKAGHDPAHRALEASGHLWYADLPKGTNFKMLYSDGKVLPRARSQGFMPIQNKAAADNKTLILPEDFSMQGLENTGIEVLIRPTFAWTMNILPVKQIDQKSRRIATTVGGTYPLDPQPQWSLDAHHITETCWLENHVSFIDKPGEWALDTTTGRLWIWPTDDQKPQNVSAPQCTQLFLLNGDIMAEASADYPVSGLVFKNLTFANNDRYTWQDAEPGFQHDWSAVDQANAMLRFRGAEHCAVEGCEFTDGGSAGIRLDLHCRYNRIEGNIIANIGEHGIAVCGYGPGTKDVSQFNEIRNNNIHHTGQQYWYGSGIYIAQSGENIIANNLIHHTPFIGITISGTRDFKHGSPRDGEGYRAVRWNEISASHKSQIAAGYAAATELTALFYPYLHARNNVIRDNEIFSVVETMGDGNAIYLSGAGTGNMIRRNFIHDIFSAGVQTALRPDDLQEQTLFSENIIYKCVYGAVEHKHDNSYVNNIFANIYPVNRNGEMWDEWAYVIFGRGPNHGTRIQNNIFYDDIGTEFRFYYARKGSPLTDALIDNNIYYSTKAPDNAQKQLSALKASGIDKHSIVSDPLFQNIQKQDFRLQPGSPAHQIGFKQIDRLSIGIQTHWRKRVIGSKLLATTMHEGRTENGSEIIISMKCESPDATIRFTTDGSEPTTTSEIYRRPFKLKGPAFIRAKSFKNGWLDLYGFSNYFMGVR
ncbi:MAG: hypothetical protein BGO21_32025 [Dyadobacter sp. 50-39]|nr:MAG: hypothetical protein BGO21_32025 [Dyadobacter sp. 50-39]